MKLSGNTILITGGASGIGYAMAERFLAAGSRVIIVGRREEKLKEAQAAHPELIIRRCDVSQAEERLALFDWVVKEYGDINVLVNNAGVQRSINLTTAGRDWNAYKTEIETNLDAPIHLSMLFVPYFLEKGDGTVINVSSRLGLMPAGWVPIYTSTKAGLHFFTQALRLQLSAKPINVIGVLPPMVDTDLAGVGAQATGVSVDEFTDAIMKKLEAGVEDIGYANAEFALSNEYTRDIANEEAKKLWNMFAQKLPFFENLRS